MIEKRPKQEMDTVGQRKRLKIIININDNSLDNNDEKNDSLALPWYTIIIIRISSNVELTSIEMAEYNGSYNSFDNVFVS